jgi:hypothetical protein
MAHGLVTSISTPQGSENNWVPVHTTASSLISVITLLVPEEMGREKRAKKEKKRKDRG